MHEVLGSGGGALFSLSQVLLDLYILYPFIMDREYRLFASLVGAPHSLSINQG